MNKKGYTLIELLAVLAIMAAILLVAVPSITKQLTSVEDNNYNQFKQNVFLAAQAYISASPDSFSALKSGGGEACINVEDLIENGWIKSTMKNPKTEEKINPNSSVFIRNQQGELKYSYQPQTKCS